MGALAFAVWHVGNNRKTLPSPPPPIAPPTSPFDETLAGSGILEPQTENISIGSSLPGVVVEVHAKVGQKVEAGDALFRLDDRHEQAELKNRQAAVTSAQAELSKLKNEPRAEQLPIVEAQIDRAEAELADQQDQLRRVRPLVERNIATSDELFRREQAVKRAVAELARAQAELDLLAAGAWKFDLDVAAAAIVQAEAQEAQVMTEMGRLTVRALVAGEVLQVNVRPGEYVGAPPGEALVVLGNVELLHARVDIDEHDIPRFRAEASARASVRGSAEKEYPLTFVRIEPYVVPKRSLTGENTERVDTRVLQVIYSLEPEVDRLYVGQQIDVFIDAGGDSTPTSKKPPAPARVSRAP